MQPTPSSSQSQSSGPEQESGGTPEKFSLTVKLLENEWIVENALGKSLGSAEHREDAIEIARTHAAAENASAISVLAEDGSLESSIKP